MSGDTQNKHSVTKDYLGTVANSLSCILEQLTSLLTEVKSNIKTKDTDRKPRQLPDNGQGTRSFYDRYGIDAAPEYCEPKNVSQDRRTSAPRNWKPFKDSAPSPAGQCQGSETDLIEKELSPPNALSMRDEHNITRTRRKWTTDITAQKRRLTWAPPNWLTKMLPKLGSPRDQPSPPPKNIRQQQSPQVAQLNCSDVPPQRRDITREPITEQGKYWFPLENEGKPKTKPKRIKKLERQNAQDKGLFWVPVSNNDNAEVKKNKRSQTKREPALQGLRRALSAAGPSKSENCPPAKQQPVNQKAVRPKQQNVPPPTKPKMPKLPDVGLAPRRFYDQHGIDPLKESNFAQNAGQIRRSNVPSEWVPPAPARSRPGEFAKPKVISIERRFYAQHGLDVPPEYKTPAVPSQSKRRSAPEPSLCPDTPQRAKPCMDACPSLATYQKPKFRKWDRPQQQRQSYIPKWIANAGEQTVVSSKQRKRKPHIAKAGASEVSTPAGARNKKLSNIPQQVKTPASTRSARAKRSQQKCGRQSGGFDIPPQIESTIHANPASGGLQKTVLLPRNSFRLPLDSLETLRQNLSERDQASVGSINHNKPGPNLQIPSLNAFKPTKLSEQIGKSIVGKVANRLSPRMPEKTISTAKYYETADITSGKGKRITFSEPITTHFDDETSENPVQHNEYEFLKARPSVVNLKAQNFAIKIGDDYQRTPIARINSTQTNLPPKLKPRQKPSKRVAEIEAIEPTKETRVNPGSNQKIQETPVKLVDSLGSLGWDLLKNSYPPALAL